MLEIYDCLDRIKIVERAFIKIDGQKELINDLMLEHKETM